VNFYERDHDVLAEWGPKLVPVECDQEAPVTRLAEVVTAYGPDAKVDGNVG
jgi:hypothetical protein